MYFDSFILKCLHQANAILKSLAAVTNLKFQPYTGKFQNALLNILIILLKSSRDYQGITSSNVYLLAVGCAVFLMLH